MCTCDDKWNIMHYIAAWGRTEYFNYLLDFDKGIIKDLLNEHNEDGLIPSWLAGSNNHNELDKLMGKYTY